jgi:hypothetical protein
LCVTLLAYKKDCTLYLGEASENEKRDRKKEGKDFADTITINLLANLNKLIWCTKFMSIVEAHYNNVSYNNNIRNSCKIIIGKTFCINSFHNCSEQKFEFLHAKHTKNTMFAFMII